MIGFPGIDDLCLWSADVRVIELFIICMEVFRVMIWLFVGVYCVKGRQRRGWFTRDYSRVLVSDISC